MVISVYNTYPNISEDVNSELLDIFRKYIQNNEAFPYLHQNASFKHITSNKEVILVAGTAAGKTLAAAIPILWKIKKQEINKVIFLYPTIALLEDQQRVLLNLADIFNLKDEIGYIFGGLNRTILIKNLNKKIIVATPDSIYWFFQKNVKYSALLIYGISLVDEFILDEAHLFSGLMLKNIENLFIRINKLREKYLHKDRAKLHLLTATFEPSLSKLSSGIKIDGKSKCGDVKVTFINKTDLYSSVDYLHTIEQTIKNNYNRILVVCNSAKTAHQLFENSKNKKVDINMLSSSQIFKFGTIKTSDLIGILEKIGMNSEEIEDILSKFIPTEGITLKNFPENVTGEVNISELIDVISREIESVTRGFSKIFQKKSEMTLRELEDTISGSNLTIKTFLKLFLKNNITDINQKINLIKIEEWIAELLDLIEKVYIEDKITGKKDYLENKIESFLLEAFNDNDFCNLFLKKIKHLLNINIILSKLTKKEIVRIREKVSLKFLDIEEKIKEELFNLISKGNISISIRYVKQWNNSKVPIILYTGSMSKNARGGLIELFSDKNLLNAILISTSAVEVGVDFDADVLITEKCEGNSFLQRFGRVGRRGKLSEAIVLVDGNTYGILKDKFQVYKDKKVSREEFSHIIKEFFPKKVYATESTFLDSIHLLISEEIGRIGRSIAAEIGENKSKDLSEKIKSSNIKFSYGLRGSLPSISLKEGITKDPFYILRYVEEAKLYASTSPFEIAKAEHYFTELLYKEVQYEKVFVDLDKSLKETIWLFYIWNDKIEVVKFQNHNIVINNLEKLNYTTRETFKKILKNWNIYGNKNDPLCQAIYNLKNWNNIILDGKDKLQLRYGNIYLKRKSKQDFKAEEVRDNFQNSLIIPHQLYLVISGIERSKLINILKSAKVDNIEEVYYDCDGFEDDVPSNFVMLEKVSGACFYVYKKLIEYM